MRQVATAVLTAWVATATASASALAVGPSSPEPVSKPGSASAPALSTAPAQDVVAAPANVVVDQDLLSVPLATGAGQSPSTVGNSTMDAGNHRLSAGLHGISGLLRTSSARLGPEGLLRMSLYGEYFTLDDFPVLGARDSRSAATLSFGYAFFDWLEAFFSYASSANSNSRSNPQLMQSQGDLSLGAKAALDAGGGFGLGAEARFLLLPGLGSADASTPALGVAPKLLASYDARSAAKPLPLIGHLNLGGSFDNAATLSRPSPLTPSEEFALGVHQYDRLTVGLGLEAPLPYFTPFVEYGLAYPLGASQLLRPDNVPVGVAEAMPQQASLGVKVTMLRDLTFLAALDLGLTRYVARGIPATQPYNLMFGLSYALDPRLAGTTKVVERTLVIERRVIAPAPAPPSVTGRVAGIVFDAQTRQPIGGAIIAQAGALLPPVASDAATGRFLSHEVLPGRVQFTFSRDGYRAATLEATVETGKVTSLQAWLSRDASAGAAAGPAPLPPLPAPPGASAQASSAKASSAQATTAQTASAKAATPAAADPNAGDSPTTESAPPPAPAASKRTLITVKSDRIVLKQPLQFAPGGARLMPKSHPMLDQVAEAIISGGLKKVRVEGHTDNKGKKADNLKMSSARAAAVADYLVKAGVDRKRISSAGYGDTRPVAPNLTARGRELNRRIEFVILGR